ncbi:hypothetical protein UACE39S_05918 [Ureibacillus acetophenoni]
MNIYPSFGQHNPYGMQRGAHASSYPFVVMPFQQYPNHMMNLQMQSVPTSFSPVAPSECISQAAINLLLTFRDLWEEHISWTRMAIEALVFNQPNTNETVTRLLRNADDMGEALQTIYGPRVGSLFRNLIRNHLTVAADLVKAAIAGDQAKFAELDKIWTQNGIAIATFLNRINPYIKLEEFQNLFLQHLEQTKNEASLMIQKQYTKDIELYDEMQQHIREIADYITEAIVMQFPHMFM